MLLQHLHSFPRSRKFYPVNLGKLTDFRSILIRRHAHCLLERAAEILRILIAEAVGYLADALAGLREQLLGHIHRPLLDVFLRRAAGLLLYQVAEVVGREMQLVGTPCHGGRVEALVIVRHEIAVEQRLETFKDVLVRRLPKKPVPIVYDLGGIRIATNVYTSQLHFPLHQK